MTFSEDMNPTTLNGTLTNFTVRTTLGQPGRRNGFVQHDDTDRDFLPNGEPRRQHGLHRDDHVGGD